MKITPISLSTVGIASLVSITLLSGAVLSSSNTFADGDDSSVDNISITVPVACTITPTIDSAHTATINPNTYEDDIGLTTIKTVCNDNNGYSVYAVGYTNEEFGNTNLIGQNTNQTIVTGTATGANSNDPSNWAMKINAVTGTYAPTIENSFGSYHIVPSTWTKVATFASSTDATIGSSIQSTYAAYISGTQAADTYNGKVKYTLVHPAGEEPLSPQPATPGYVVYHPNGSNVVGTMGDQYVNVDMDENIELLASNFSRTGYGFAGWSTTFDYSDPNGFYGPQETIEIPEDISTNGLSLYAYWVKSAGSLQGWTGCSSLSNGGVTALTDQRDNETYAIAKLADGNCWMIENLRLESTNSDNATGALAQGYGTSSTYGNFSGLADAEGTNFKGNYSSATAAAEPNSLYYAGTQSGTATVNISQTDYASLRMPRYNNYNHQTISANRPQNPTSNTATNSVTGASMYSYGNYYTWTAAIADTSSLQGASNTNANTSICPSGWRLPKGGNRDSIESGENEYWYLIVNKLNNGILPKKYNNDQWPHYYFGDEQEIIYSILNAVQSFPNNFLISSYFYDNSIWLQHSVGGYYWSSTSSGFGLAYGLSLYARWISPGTDAIEPNTYYGYSVRCISDS